MLLPKRVKHRKVQRGRLKGTAHRGNKVTYGQFGLVALEPAWITSNQIEAARTSSSKFLKSISNHAILYSCSHSTYYIPKHLPCQYF